MRRSLLVLSVVGALALGACSSSSVDGETTTSGGSAGSTETTAPESSGGTDTTTTTAPAGAGGGGDAGSATLVVGDQTYEFDNYYCFQGSDNTGNSRVSFSSGAFGEVDGVRVQLDASIQDTDETNAMDGDGTIQSISLNDVENFQSPTVGWDAVTGFIGAPAWVVEYDGSTVHAEAEFDDLTTEETLETIPGTLDAVCGG